MTLLGCAYLHESVWYNTSTWESHWCEYLVGLYQQLCIDVLAMGTICQHESQYGQRCLKQLSCTHR